MNSKLKLSIRILFCIVVGGVFVYSYIQKQNALTSLRLEIPVIDKELRVILEDNKRLKYEIDQFKSPSHLMALAQQPEFAHLRYPHSNELVILPLSIPLPCLDDSASVPCRVP